MRAPGVEASAGQSRKPLLLLVDRLQRPYSQPLYLCNGVVCRSSIQVRIMSTAAHTASSNCGSVLSFNCHRASGSKAAQAIGPT